MLSHCGVLKFASAPYPCKILFGTVLYTFDIIASEKDGTDPSGTWTVEDLFLGFWVASAF
jgi:hypothetical protein